MAASPVPSWGPKRGRKCFITPAFSGIPNIGEQNLKWLPHPCLLGGPKEGGNVTSPLHSRGSPTPSARSKIRSGPQQRGTKSEVATSPLPSRGPKRGRKCFITPAFSGIPNIGEHNLKWLPYPCLLGGPKEGGNVTSPLHSRSSPMPSARSKIRSGPQQRGTKSEVATSPLPSRGPKRGRKCFITPAFSGIPNIGEHNLKWLPHPCLLGGPKEGGNVTSPLHSRGSPMPSARSKIRSGPQQRGTKSEVATSPLPSRGPKRGRKCFITPAFSGIPNIGEHNLKWLPHPCLLGGPKEGGNVTSPLHSRGSPMPSARSKIRSGPQQRGTKSEVATSPLPSRGPKRGRKCCVTPAFSGTRTPSAGAKSEVAASPPHSQGSPTPSAGSKIRSGPQHRGIKSEVATSPLLSRGPKRGQTCYVTPAFSGFPNAKRREQNQKWSPAKGHKIRSGYLTPAFLGAQKRAEMLRHPCILREPERQAREQNQKWLPHLCILRDPQRQARGAKSEVVPNTGEQNQRWMPHPCLCEGPKEGGNATSPLYSQGSPTRGSKRALTRPLEKIPSQ